MEEGSQRPLVVVDEKTHAEYVLLPAAAYERLRALLGDEPFDIRDTYPAQDRALRAIWDDPALDVYNEPESP